MTDKVKQIIAKLSQEAIDLSAKLTLNNQIRLDYQPNRRN